MILTILFTLMHCSFGQLGLEDSAGTTYEKNKLLLTIRIL